MKRATGRLLAGPEVPKVLKRHLADVALRPFFAFSSLSRADTATRGIFLFFFSFFAPCNRGDACYERENGPAGGMVMRFLSVRNWGSFVSRKIEFTGVARPLFTSRVEWSRRNAFSTWSLTSKSLFARFRWLSVSLLRFDFLPCLNSTLDFDYAENISEYSIFGVEECKLGWQCGSRNSFIYLLWDALVNYDTCCCYKFVGIVSYVHFRFIF